MTKRVVLMGKGLLAVRIAQWFYESENHTLEYIIPVIPEPTWTESLMEWATTHHINIVQSGHYRGAPEIEKMDLVISVFYDKIINESFIRRCKNIINLHNSPLPKYRGVSPINWALKDNQTEHGVTIHQIRPGIDDGPVLGQVKYSIYPDFEEVTDVYNKALDYAYTLFTKTIPIVDRIKPRPQNEEEIIYHSSKDNCLLGERRYFTKEISLGEKTQ